MSRDWILLETLGAAPTVVAIGTQPRNMTPIDMVLRRNRHLSDIEAAVARCVATGEAIVEQTAAADRVIRVHPVAVDRTQVHGVQVFFGPVDGDLPDRPLVGASVGNMDTAIATSSDEYLDVLGLDPKNRSRTRNLAEDFTRILPNENDIEMFSNVVSPESHTAFCASCPVADDAGTVRQILFAGRMLHEPVDGGVNRVARIVGLRLDSPTAKPRTLLAQQILSAVAIRGRHRALVNIHNLSILRWIDDPYPRLAWEYMPGVPSGIHPDDHATAGQMRTELLAGSTSGVLRLPRTDGGWLPVHLYATKFALRDNVFAALVTFSAPGTDTQ